MSAYWLVAAFLGFIAAFAALMFISFRERKRAKQNPTDSENQASDKLLALMVLFAILWGAGLALFVGFVVFSAKLNS